MTAITVIVAACENRSSRKKERKKINICFVMKAILIDWLIDQPGTEGECLPLKMCFIKCKISKSLL